jgi:hypothetical protein
MYLKKICLTLFVCLYIILTTSSGAFAGRTYETKEQTDKGQHSDLVILGKIWGFLKYHHPEIIRGKYDWDDQIIKFIPAYLACKNHQERNMLLSTWITGLGVVPKYVLVPYSIKIDFKSKPDYTWINHSDLPTNLKSLLGSLTKNHSSNQYYLSYQTEDDVVAASFSHEKNYSDTSQISTKFRLLAVFKWWSIIEYWYPYKYLTGNWEKNLGNFVSDALLATSSSEYRMLIQKMVSAIGDTHADIIASQVEVANGRWELPFTIKFLEGKAVVSSVNQGTKTIKVGYIIQSINGVQISRLIDKKSPFVPASNKPALLRKLSSIITRMPDSTAHLVLEDNFGIKQSLDLKNIKVNPLAKKKTFDFAYQKDSSFYKLSEGVIYTNIANIKDREIPLIKKLLDSAKGMVVDCRQYPYYSGAYLMINLLLPHPTAVSKYVCPVKGFPGAFRYTKPMIIGQENPTYFKGKVVVLVNENTISASELYAMAFRLSPNSVIVGSTTSGADGNVSPLISLPGGYYARMTSLGVYYPDGRETQQVGIVPEITVKQSIQGLRNQHDELLNRAIAEINEKG